MIAPDVLIAEARKLLGVPWVHQGRTKRGVDCLGFIWLTCRNAGYDVIQACGAIDRRDYGRSPTDELVEAIQKCCVRVTLNELVPGAMIFFQFPKELKPRHVAFYFERNGEPRMIHAHSRRGRKRVVEHGYRGKWVEWTHSVWLIPGVAYE